VKTELRLDWCLQWSATFLTLLGAVLTSWGGVPDWARVAAFGTGTLLWFIFSLRIGIRSLIVVNGGLLVVYIFGAVNTIFYGV
jgi:hypothetical protein